MRRFIIAAILLLGLGAVLAWAFSRPSEPMYDGKPLSFWLERYAIINQTETSTQEADHALDAIGTNAIPTLLRFLESKDSRFKARVMSLLAQQKLVKIKWLPAEEIQRVAIHGFERLQGSGSFAVPGLIEIYKRNISDSSRGAVITSLLVIGPAAKDAVPMLIALPLKDTNAIFRMTAVDTLGVIHSNPELTVPALTRSLDDRDMIVRLSAAGALSKFGTNAKSAIPPLKAMLNDGDQNVRQFVSNALAKVDPSIPIHSKSQ